MYFRFKAFVPIIFLLCFASGSYGQYTLSGNLSALDAATTTGISATGNTDSLPRQVKKARLLSVAGTNVVLWTGTFMALNKAWYAGYSRSRFHLFNDFGEWNQMDKAGHIWTSYHISRISAGMWQWTGLREKTSSILGGISGVAYQSIIEIQDGYSREWGFSWGDMAANLSGAAAFVVQQLAWHDQRILTKFSYSPYRYPPDLVGRRDQLFGNSFQERILKDYNAQTYWLSANLHSFFPDAALPRWLNISFGYRSTGLLGGTQNIWVDKGGIVFDRTDIPRVRRWFIAPDVDLTRIKTRSNLLHTVFTVVNVLKFPAPALEIGPKGRLKVHPVYF